MNAHANITDRDFCIYIADLAAYNAGHLHGVWVDATDEPDDILDQINTMLKASPVDDAEEYGIHDHGGFKGYSVNENEGIQATHDKALFIEAHGQVGADILDYLGDDLDEAKTAIEDNYHGI